MNRRRGFAATAAVVCLSFNATLASSGSASAQSYPSRPVRLIVGVAAGSFPDIIARQMGQLLSERLGQSFVIEPRPGAGGNIAAEAVVRATPDGYTLLLVAPSAAINATLYDKLKFNFMNDIEPVASILRTADVMVVHPSVPARTISEFIAYAKANPGKLNMASPGTGSAPHLSGELFKMMAGIDMVHVPYRGGGPAMTDLISGQVQITFVAPTVAVEHIATGKVRALAVTTATRSHVLPDVPAMAEFLAGYESNGWFGIGAPKGTPFVIVETLNREINAALADPKTKVRLTAMGYTVLTGSPSDFGKLIAAETEKMGKVVKLTGIKPN